jgi:hypothetical protein
MSRMPTLLVSCLEPYLSYFDRWLRECRTAINISKSTAMLFTRWRIQKPRPVLLFGAPILRVHTARYLGVTLHKRLTWSPQIDQVRKKAAQRLGMLGLLLNRRSRLSNRNGALLYRQLIRPNMRAPHGGPHLAATSGSCRSFSPSVFALLLVHLGTYVTGKFTRIWKLRFSPTTSEP